MSEIQGNRILAPDPIENIFMPEMWTVVHAPATNVQATATKSAGAAGVKHVCYGIVASISGAAAAAAAAVGVQVLDGASVVFSATLAAPANQAAQIQLTGLSIIGTAATSMTIQFVAAGGAGTFEAVTLIGFDIQ